MSDFDALVAEAEGFEEDFVDIPDDFIADTGNAQLLAVPNSQQESKKRAPLTDMSPQIDNKKPKATIGFLADYFTVSNKEVPNAFLPKSNDYDENSGQQKGSQRCYKCNKEGHWAKDCTEKAPSSTTVFKAMENATSASSIVDAPSCECALSALQKTVLKDGPNKDRKFWVCPQPREQQCKFFEWCDGDSNQRQTAQISNLERNATQQYYQQSQQPSSQTQTQVDGGGGGSNGGGGGGPSCKCGIPSVERTVMKDGPNKDRKFWVCAQPRDSQCKFFEWADAPGVGAAVPPFASSSAAMHYGSGVYGPRLVPSTDYGGIGASSYAKPAAVAANTGSGRAAFAGYAGYAAAGAAGGAAGAAAGGSMNSSSGGGGKSGSCFKCKQEGHWSNNCPNTGSSFNSSYSRGGGSAAGGANGVGGGGAGGRGGGGGGKSGTCFKCKQEGHWSNNCPNAGSSSYRGGGGGGGGGRSY